MFTVSHLRLVCLVAVDRACRVPFALSRGPDGGGVVDGADAGLAAMMALNGVYAEIAALVKAAATTAEALTAWANAHAAPPARHHARTGRLYTWEAARCLFHSGCQTANAPPA